MCVFQYNHLWLHWQKWAFDETIQQPANMCLWPHNACWERLEADLSISIDNVFLKEHCWPCGEALNPPPTIHYKTLNLAQNVLPTLQVWWNHLLQDHHNFIRQAFSPICLRLYKSLQPYCKFSYGSVFKWFIDNIGILNSVSVCKHIWVRCPPISQLITDVQADISIIAKWVTVLILWTFGVPTHKEYNDIWHIQVGL